MRVEYEAIITDPTAIQKIQNTKLHVSLGADYERIDYIDDFEVLRNIVFSFQFLSGFQSGNRCEGDGRSNRQLSIPFRIPVTLAATDGS